MYIRILTIAGCTVMLASCMSTNSNKHLPKVMPFAETDSVASTGDAADDPAVWVHKQDASKSLVLGTDKQAGLYVFDLQGRKQQFLPTGALNNVDLRQNVMFGRDSFDIAAATNRTINGVSLFNINANGKVSDAGAFKVPTTEPYGLCVGYDESGYRVFVTFKTGEVEIHEVSKTKTGYEATLRNTLKFGSQLEGCSYDEVQNVLFVGEEARGIWRVDLNGNQEFSRSLLDRVGSETGLVADVEGVDIWKGKADSGYLVVSAQEGDRYVVYQRAAPNAWVGTFAITETEDGLIDGVTHTDGLTVSSANLGGNLDKGILVVQDDSNGKKGTTQNFKFVAWSDVIRVLNAKETSK